MDKIQAQYSDYQMIKQKYEGKVRPRPIVQPLDRWFDRKFDLKDKQVLDIGCLVESKIYHKFVAQNAGKAKGYFGYDIDKQTVDWLKDIDAYVDIFATDKKFDYIFLIDVYEHLSPDERIKLIGRFRKLLKPGGQLCMMFPYTGNLNYFENFVGDWTHKLVKLEFEPAALVAFGNFKMSSIEIYLGGLTLPSRSFVHNVLCIWRNLICLYPPFHVGILVVSNDG